MNEVDLMSRSFYCTVCKILTQNPVDHREDEHDGEWSIDINRVVSEEGGQWIAQDSDMGHYTPHMWVDVDGQDMCSECGAVKIAEEIVDEYVGDNK